MSLNNPIQMLVFISISADIYMSKSGEAEIARPGNCQNGKCTTWKIPEWAMYNPEIDRKFRPWKMTENHAWKMP